MLGHPIKEVKAIFARELISPEISEDETTIESKKQQNTDGNQLEEIYFIPSITWHSNKVMIFKNILL